MASPDPVTIDYRCPGQHYAISRQVHLGRLTRFYSLCRQCQHRHDTGAISPRQSRQLAEIEPRRLGWPALDSEGAAGVYLNDVSPLDARQWAVAMGAWLRECATSATDAAAQKTAVAVLANDGRPLVAELAAAVAEGLRWTGCHVVDVGPATAASLTLAIDYLGADGAILLGNPGRQPATVGLKFWAPGPSPLASDGWEHLERLRRHGTDRPTRVYGSLRRFQADAIYLAALAGHYHALRPLRFVLDSASAPLISYLNALTEPTACQAMVAAGEGGGVSNQIERHSAHFGFLTDGDGETCTVLDERGRHVPPDRLLVLLARHLLRENPASSVVLDPQMPARVAQRIEELGGRPVLVVTGQGPVVPPQADTPGTARPDAGTSRAEMARAMRAHDAILGADRRGRFWFAPAGPPLPDALMALSLLLELLSRSDRRFSEVLDREAAVD